MQRLRLEILGVSETRWTGAGEVRFSGGETFLYSGNADENAPHEKGVGLFLSQLAYNSLMEWEPVSERSYRLNSELSVKILLSFRSMPQPN